MLRDLKKEEESGLTRSGAGRGLEGSAGRVVTHEISPKIETGGASAMADYLSAEFAAWLEEVRLEQEKRIGPLLDAKLLEAQTLRLAEGHKARERTLHSTDMARAPSRPSPAAA